MIPDDVVEEVRARADIVDIVGQVVDLKKSGKEFKAKCPFHEERTPSFYVVPDKGFYKCFGCGQSGDVFTFVMERMGLDFVEAVKHVGKRAGVEVREVKTGRPEEDPDRPLYELNAFARQWFVDQLQDPEEGRAARDYLAERGIDQETIERFGLGWAPDDWRALRNACAHHDFDDDLLLEVGLLNQSERAKQPYDRFRARVIFPIEAVSGKTVAFGGRLLGSDTSDAPKYLNSPESPIYHKGRLLYGLSWGRHAVRREDSALVVEGYMDLVALAAAGFENVVATLGTSMTQEHARLLGRYSKKILLLFDSDRAGLKATFRAGDILLEAGLHPSVVTFPPGEDPDTLVRKEGPEALQAYLDDAVDVLDRKFQILDERGYFSGIDRLRAAVDRLLPTLRAVADPTLRDIYISKVASRTEVKRETLEEEVRQEASIPSSAPSRPSPRRRSAGPGRPSTRAPRLPAHEAERKLLLLMTRSADYVEKAGERLGKDDFRSSAYRAVFEALLDDPELRAPSKGMDPQAASAFEKLLEDPEEIGHASRAFDDVVARIRVDAIDRQVADIMASIRATHEEAEKHDLVRQRAELLNERRALAPDDGRTTARSSSIHSDSNDWNS